MILMESVGYYTRTVKLRTSNTHATLYQWQIHHLMIILRVMTHLRLLLSHFKRPIVTLPPFMMCSQVIYPLNVQKNPGQFYPLHAKVRIRQQKRLETTSINSPGCSHQPTQSSFHSPALTESSLHHQSDHIILVSNSEHNVDGLKATLAASITNVIDCDATQRVR